MAERTQELLAEQKKTDQLLHSMLPPDVAKDLRQGKPADARSFESATIYFRQVLQCDLHTIDLCVYSS